MGSDPGMLRGAYRHVVVDEYQDLNRCDVAVIDEMGARGARLYVAGDDDRVVVQITPICPEPGPRSLRWTLRSLARFPTLTAGRLLPDFDTRADGQLLPTQKVDKQWIDELR